MHNLIVLSLALFGCKSDGQIELINNDVDIEITAPTYGAFVGDGPAVVQGVVSDPGASVTVEGRGVDVNEDGSFEIEIEVPDAYLNIDAEATLNEGYARDRVPVFSGQNPLDTWPGGMTARLTPAGYEVVGERLGLTLDAMGWDEMLLANLPTVGDFTPVAIHHDDSVVILTPADDGVDVALSLRQVEVEYLWTNPSPGWPLPDTLTIILGTDEILIGALAIPYLDADGKAFATLTDTTIDFTDYVISIDGYELYLIQFLLDMFSDALMEPLGEGILDSFLENFDELELGGPFVQETEIMGTPMEIRLSDLFGDLEGLGAGVGMGIGEPVALGPLAIPAPAGQDEAGQIALGIHEGLFQLIMGEGLTDALMNDLPIEGLDMILGTVVKNLPGGEVAPGDQGWCTELIPGEASVVRMEERLDPLAALYLPDFQLHIATGPECTPWLEASLAIKAGIFVEDGSKLAIDMEVEEGVVLYYATTAEWEEQEVVEGLGGFFETAMSIAGGAFSFDLADLLAGFNDGSGSTDPLSAMLDGTSLQLIESKKLLDADGNWPEGLYAVYANIWDE